MTAGGDNATGAAPVVTDGRVSASVPVMPPVAAEIEASAPRAVPSRRPTDTGDSAAADDTALGADIDAAALPEVRTADHAFPISFALATAVHVLVIVALTRAPSSPVVWSGGSQLQSIEVDVVASLGDLARSGDSDVETSSMANTPEPPKVPEKPVARIEMEPDKIEAPADPDRPQLVVAEKIEPPVEVTPPEKPTERQETTNDSSSASASTLRSVAGVTIAMSQPGELPSAVVITAEPGEVSAYKRSIVAALARQKPRPTSSKQGTVRIKFKIGLNGEIEDATVAKSSGRRDLDEAALSAVLATRFEMPPFGMKNSDLSYEIPYIFR